MKLKENDLFKSSFLILLLLGVILRVWALVVQPLFFDETISLDIARTDYLPNLFEYLNEYETQVPAYYVMLFGIDKIFSSNFYLMKIPSLIAGILSGIFLYQIGKREYSKKVALVASSLMFLTFINCIYSIEVRPYAMMSLFSTILTGTALAPETTKRKFLLFAFAFLGLSSLHYFGIFFAIFVSIPVIFSYRHRFSQSPAFYAGVTGFIFTSLLPYSFKFLKDFNTYHSYRRIPGLEQIGGAYALILPSALGLFIFLALFGLYLKKIKSKADRVHFFFLCFLSFFPLIITIIKSLGSAPVFEVRYLVITFPAFYLLVGIMAEKIFNQKLWWLVFLVISAVSLGDTVFKRKLLTEPYRMDTFNAVQYAKDLYEKQNGSIIYSCGICLDDYLYPADYKCMNKDLDAAFMKKYKYIITLNLLWEGKGCDGEYYLNRYFKHEETKEFSGVQIKYYSSK